MKTLEITCRPCFHKLMQETAGNLDANKTRNSLLFVPLK